RRVRRRLSPHARREGIHDAAVVRLLASAADGAADPGDDRRRLESGRVRDPLQPGRGRVMRRTGSTWLPPVVLLAPAPVHAAAPAAGAQANPAMPKAHNISYYYDGLEQGLMRPISRTFDPVVLAHRLSGKKRECVNVDANDQVLLPSTWWQPRL